MRDCNGKTSEDDDVEVTLGKNTTQETKREEKR